VPKLFLNIARALVGHQKQGGIGVPQVVRVSGFDKIDVGVYIVTTKNFQKKMGQEFDLNWKGSLSFEKVTNYLPHFKSAIQVPIYVIGLDL
jgi:hypothetical protein